MSKENWRQCRDFPSYEISNLGRLRHRIKKRLRKTRSLLGYEVIHLNNGKGLPHKMARIHRLVAEAFIPNPKNYPFVDHINRQKRDNRAINLRWATRKMNNENRGKLSEERAWKLILLYQQGIPMKEILKRL